MNLFALVAGIGVRMQHPVRDWSRLSYDAHLNEEDGIDLGPTDLRMGTPILHLPTLSLTLMAVVSCSQSGLIGRSGGCLVRPHRAHQLEVVVVGVGERRDRRTRYTLEPIRLPDADRSRGLQGPRLTPHAPPADVPT